MLSIQGLIAKDLKRQDKLPEKWNDMACEPLIYIPPKDLLDSYLALCARMKTYNYAGTSQYYGYIKIPAGTYCCYEKLAKGEIVWSKDVITVTSEIKSSNVAMGTSSANSKYYSYVMLGSDKKLYLSSSPKAPTSTVKFSYIGSAWLSNGSTSGGTRPFKNDGKIPVVQW